MARPTTEFGDFSGVDSRSSPLRLPPGRALRCKNWVPGPNGVLQLRYGYTRIPMTQKIDTTPHLAHMAPPIKLPVPPYQSVVHSAFYVEPSSGATPYVLVGAANTLWKINVDNTGTASEIGLVDSANQWNGVFADDKFMFGNVADALWYDGTTVRKMGVRAPTTAEAASVSVSYSTGSVGTWSTTLYSGYQIYFCFYNQVTQECGNRIAIGNRIQINTPNGVLQITGLPNTTAENAEWVKLIGRTPDNGQVPNAFIDGSGNYVVASGTTATIVLDTTDPESELPTRNGLPPRFDKIAWVLGRAYAIDEDDPSAVRYSESQSDLVTGVFVGDPRTSWPANSKVYHPSGEHCRAIHGVENTAWVWTHNYLAILSELTATDSGLGRATLQWVGMWVGGIAGQRAFSLTRYGPFWVSAEKQLMTRSESGAVPASSTYESALLARISDGNLPYTEVTYLVDPEKDIDCLYILGADVNNDDVIIVHDFGAGGIGREYQYNGIDLNTFVRNPQTIVSARDRNGKMRLWTGAQDGYFYQLEEGDYDLTENYDADLIGIFNAGPGRPTIGALEYFGDANIKFTVSDDLTLTLDDLGLLDSIPVQYVDKKTALYRVPIEQRRQYYLMRIQLESHATDGGTLAPSTPVPHVPLETYGRMYLARPEIGAPRTIGGSNP